MLKKGRYSDQNIALFYQPEILVSYYPLIARFYLLRSAFAMSSLCSAIENSSAAFQPYFYPPTNCPIYILTPDWQIRINTLTLYRSNES